MEYKHLVHKLQEAHYVIRSVRENGIFDEDLAEKYLEYDGDAWDFLHAYDTGEFDAKGCCNGCDNCLSL